MAKHRGTKGGCQSWVQITSGEQSVDVIRRVPPHMVNACIIRCTEIRAGSRTLMQRNTVIHTQLGGIRTRACGIPRIVVLLKDTGKHLRKSYDRERKSARGCGLQPRDMVNRQHRNWFPPPRACDPSRTLYLLCSPCIGSTLRRADLVPH